MACGYNVKNAMTKSSSMCYNSTAQSISATGNTVAILGTQGTDTGCAINAITNGFQIKSKGLYRVSFDIDFTCTATGGGTAAVVLQKDGVTLPCVNSKESLAQNGIAIFHGETVLYIPNTCCAYQPVISAFISGVDGTVTNVCANCVKLQ